MNELTSTALQVRGVHHIAIKTVRVDQLAGFYSAVLRLEEMKRHVDERGLRSVWLLAGDVVLMIERSETPRADTPRYEEDPPGLHFVALKVPPQEHRAWTEHLDALDVRVADQTPFTTYFTDPDGNRVGLSSWPEARPA